MAVMALTDAFVYADGYDFTGDSNQLGLQCEADQLDATTFGSGGWREHVAGLKTSTLDVQGFWQSAETDAPDPQIFPNLGAGAVVTLGPVDTEGQPAFMLQALRSQYSLLGAIGELAPFTLQGGCRDGQGVIRGQLAKAKGSVSGTGALGSVLNLGAPTSTQYVYATFHVFSAGTTITVLVESDTASNFPSATTRATIGPITTAGGTWVTRVAGPFAGETHWRLNVSAITGTFTVAGAIAVQ